MYSRAAGTANLHTKILDCRGFDSSRILIVRGRILMLMREFPGKFESTNLSRDNLSREIGGRLRGHPLQRTGAMARWRVAQWHWCAVEMCKLKSVDILKSKCKGLM